jgi:Spy/CpxP family protein refolding chaperone
MYFIHVMGEGLFPKKSGGYLSPKQKECIMKRIILLTCMCAFILTSTGFAKMGGHGFLPPGKWWHMPKVVESLKITDDEKTFLDQLFMEKRKAMIQVKSEMETKKLEMEAIMEKDPFDEDAALKKFETMHVAGQQMMKNKFKFVIEVRKLLGKDRFIQLKSQFRRFHHGKHGRGKGHMGPPGSHGGGRGPMDWDDMN